MHMSTAKAHLYILNIYSLISFHKIISNRGTPGILNPRFLSVKELYLLVEDYIHLWLFCGSAQLEMLQDEISLC
jgi:hypothetical protein